MVVDDNTEKTNTIIPADAPYIYIYIYIYGIFTNVHPKNGSNLGTYSIHAASGTAI